VRGRLTRSRRRLQRALELARAAFGARDPRVAEVLNELGILGKADGRYRDAARHYRAALAIVRATRGRGQVELADLYHNLGGLEHARGRYARGEPLARLAVSLRVRRHGPDATVVWQDRAAHAALLDGLGRYAESEPVYREALAIFRRRLGVGHYDVAVTLNNLGCVRANRGDPRGAVRLLKRALVLKEQLFGARHVESTITRRNLSRAVVELGRVGEAK
jgi:tetratricopeptide (TPR) repeat protein